MDGTFADVRPGARLDIVVEFVTKRPLACDGGTVYRLLVADRTGERFNVLTTPDSDSLWHLETGATYEISGLVGATPVDTSPAGEHDCPHCGGTLRSGQPVDAAGSAVVEAATALDTEERFGVIDGTASITPVDEEATTVDDWQSMRDDEPVEAPDFVCRSCGNTVDERALARDMSFELGNHDANFRLEEMRAETSAAPIDHSIESPETVGLATGGAKDVTNFRENVANDYTPQPEAISDEGLFYDYYFETGERTATDALFAPRYVAAVSDHHPPRA